LYTSGAPVGPQANTIAHHADDLAAILDHEAVDGAVLVGWSMGVQVAFEMIRRHRSRVRGLMAINGTYAHTFHTVMGSRLVGMIIPLFLRVIRSQADLTARAARRLAASDSLIAILKRTGLASEQLDEPLFREVAAGYLNMNWRVYSDILARADEHDASAVLATIDVPVSIVTGDRDLMTPASTAVHMHRVIPGSRLVVVRGGTHYTLCEYPAILVEELGRLLERVPGWQRGHGEGQTVAGNRSRP
jgi:pimeloyl-ACP methyl ester carboxylesterase